MTKILVVEDHPMVRELCSQQLEILDYAVVAVADAEAAQRLLLDGSTFDLLLTDQSLPEMDGFDLAYWVRERNPDMPILLMTGLAAAERMAEAANIPMLLKPFSFAELEAGVEELLTEELV